MQWSNERNAGFSSVPRGRTVRPVVSRGDFGYRRVNVSDQLRDPDSLLSWLHRAMGVRRRQPEFGQGDWQPVPTGHRSLVCLKFGGPAGTVLAVHNLGRRARRARLSPDAVQGNPLVDLFTDQPYEPPDGGSVPVEGHGYRWLQLGRPV
jgi:maltose alpha-D-glucosyltransferase/alpha-amylase